MLEKINITAFFLLILWFFNPIISVQASTKQQDIKVLQKIAYHYLYGQIKLHAKQFELEVLPPTSHSKNKLDACTADQLEPFLPQYQSLLSTRTIGIRCPQQQWVTYLPVKLKVYTTVITAKQHIPRNTIIQPEHLSQKPMLYQKVRPYHYQDSKYLLGRYSKYPIKAGSAITEQALRKEYMVKRGERVEIRAQLSGIKVTSLGIALQDALRGQQVEVKNLQSQKLVKGQAVEKGVVDVIY